MSHLLIKLHMLKITNINNVFNKNKIKQRNTINIILIFLTCEMQKEQRNKNMINKCIY